MACPSPDHVLDYLGGKLDARAREELEAHVDTCTTCRQLMVELARTDMDAAVRPEKSKGPDHIGRYKVESKLGQGGMGTVFAAYDSQLDRRVAVKLVHPELAEIGGVERLVREGRALARLAHPNVVGVHDAGTDAGRIYIAMELVEGSSLAAWLREKPRHWREITEKFVEAARGIAAAHRAGIIHRDIKPENVLIDRTGHAKVADFGLAGHSEPAHGSNVDHDTDRLTVPGAVMGTPMYMSPEQRRGMNVSFATDQYSLCAALDGALHNHRGTSKPPPWLRRAIAKGTAQEASERFGSIEELILAIDPARRTRRLRRIAIAAAGVAVAGGIAATFVLTRDHDDTAAVCETERVALEGAWKPTDKTMIAGAIRATKAPYADDTAPRVVAALDVYMKDLGEAHAASCKQRPRTSESRALFDAGLRCIAERRTELALLRDRLAHPTANDARLAVTAVHELPNVDDCADPAALDAELKARATPAAVAARKEMADAISAARAAKREGKLQQAVDHAKRATKAARRFGGRLLAKALLVQGEMEESVAGAPAVEPLLRETIAEAEAAHADDLRALALARLVGTVALQAGREKEALMMEPLATAAVNRAKKTRAYLPVVLQAMGMAYLRSGETEKGLGKFQEALASAREVLPHDDPRMPDYVYMVGVALSFLQRDAEALKYQEEAYTVAADVFGPNHPNAARFTINLAAKHASLGDCPKALDELARARALLTGVLPDDSAEQLQIDQTMGACYYIQHQYDDALREFARRQNALIAANRTKSVEFASSWVDVGDVQLDRKDPAAAAESYGKAVKAYEEMLGMTDVRLALPLWRIGEAHLRANHPERAIEPLERAVKIYEASHSPAITAADAWSRLAKALWTKPAERARARELATKARDGYLTATVARAKDRAAEMDAWLAAHK